MKIATCLSAVRNRLAPRLGRVIHGGLLTVGLVTTAYHGTSFIQSGSLAFGGAAVGAASAAELHAPDLGDAVPTPVASRTVKLSPEMERVKRFVSRRYKVSRVALRPILATAESTGRKLGLDPLLLVAVIAVESSFNPFAESGVGAQGLMQVIPRFHMDKIGDDAGEDALFDPLTNIRVGAMVLKEGLQRTGSLQAALQYYGGASNDAQARYANKVLSMQSRLAVAARGSADA